MLDIRDYSTKPRDVRAVKITAENMAEAAEWCVGTVVGEGESAYIDVKTHRPLNKRQSEAHIGDYLVQQGKTFKVYLPDPFRMGFDPKRKLEISNSQTALDMPYAPGAVRENTPLFEQTVRDKSLVGLPKTVDAGGVHVPIQHDPDVD